MASQLGRAYGHPRWHLSLQAPAAFIGRAGVELSSDGIELFT